MSLSQSTRKTPAASAPRVWRARNSRSFTLRPNSCRLPTARAGSTVPRLGLNSASNRLSLYWPAKTPSDCSVWWPMPRLGVVTARRKAGSSSLLTHRRNQAHRSLISARSKKLCPPDTLYGSWALRRACSNIRAWWLARYNTAKSRSSLCWICPPALSAVPERMLRMRATTRSASCSSWSASTTRTGSPSPRSLHRFFGYNLGLGPITLLAARRMAPVER